MAERTVVWQGVADFSRARREADKTALSLAALKKEQQALNREQSGYNPKFDTSGLAKWADAARQARGETEGVATGIDTVTQAIGRYQRTARSDPSGPLTSGLRDTEKAASGAGRAVRDVSNQLRDAQGRFSTAAHEAENLARGGRDVESTFSRLRGAIPPLINNVRTLTADWGKHNNMQDQAVKSLGKGALQVAKYAGIIALAGSAIDALAGGISQALAGLTGMAGALGPVVGVLGAIPGIAAAAVGGIGTLVAGFHGIGGALKQYEAQQKKTATATTTANKAMNQQATLANTAAETARQNAQQIISAQQAVQRARTQAARQAVDDAKTVQDAQRGVVDAERQAVIDIATAERQLTDAQAAERVAQANITVARREAAQAIAALRLQLQGQRLDEEGASLSLEEAQANLRKVINDPNSNSLQRRQAEYAVDQAQRGLSDAQRQTQQLSQQYNQASKAGVNGSQQVIAAKQNEQQAHQAVSDAQQNLAQTQISALESVQKAQESLTQAQTQARRDQQDNTKAIKQALAQLADAQKEAQLRDKRLAVQQQEVAQSAGAAAAGTDLYKQAMQQLTPEAQAVVRQLIRMKGQLDTLQKTAQRGMMPGVLDFLVAIDKLFPDVNRFVGKAAGQFGGFFRQVGRLVQTTGFVDGFRKVLDEANTIIGYFLDGSIHLGKTLGAITVAAIPLTEWLFKMADGWTKAWDQMTSGEAGQKRLSDFFDKTKNVLQILGGILSNTVGALYNVFSAAAPAGLGLLKSLERTTKTWDDWTKSVKGRNEIVYWANQGARTLKALGKLFDDLVGGLAKIGKQVDFASFVDTVRKDLLPALFQLLQDLQPGKNLNGFVDLIAQVADLFDSIVKKLGGGGAILDLLSQLVGFFQAIVNHTPAGVIKAVVEAMVIGKVVGFVGKITGLADAFKLLSGGKSPLRVTLDLLKKFKDFKGGSKGVSEVAKIAEDAGKAKGAGKAGGLLKKVAGPLAKGAGKLLGRGAAAGVGEAAAGAGAEAGAVEGGLIATGVGVEAAGGAADATGVGIPIGAILAVVGAIILAVGAIIKYWKQIKAAFSAGWNWVKTESKKFGSWISSVWSALWNPIVKGAQIAWTLIKNQIINPIKQIISFISFFVRTAIAVFKVAWKVISDITRLAWAVWKFLVLDPIISLVKLIGNWLGKITNAIVGWVSSVVKWVRNHWTVIKAVVVAPFKDAWDGVTTAWNRISNWLQRVIASVSAWIRDRWAAVKTHIVKPIQDALTPVTNAIGNIFDRVTGKIADILTWIGKHLASVGRVLASPFVDAWKNHLKPAFDTIVNGVEGAMKGIKGWVDKLGGWVSAAMAPFVNAFTHPMNFIVNNVLKPLYSLLNGVSKLVNGPHFDPPKYTPPKYSAPGRKEGGVIPGAKSPKRDNVLGLSSSGVPVARVEPGEYVLPRWMSPIFGTMEAYRRARKLPGKKSGGLLGGIKAGVEGATGIGLTRPINAAISNGLHDIGVMGPNSSAVDASASVGHPVVAGASGRVAKSYDIRGYESRRPGPQDGYRSYGRVIQIDHGGFNTLYAHLSERLAKVGDQIKVGQKIGLSGDTGNSTGPHLHFGAQDIDPYNFWKSGFKRVIAAVRGQVGGAIGGVANVVTDVVHPLAKVWNQIKGKIAAAGKSPWAKVVEKVPGKIFNLVKSFITGKANDGGTSSTWSGKGVSGLGSDQLNNAATIIGVARALGFGDRGAEIALMVAMQESTLRNLHYGDRDSLGLFQQRAPWGTAAARTNPVQATRMFFLGGAGGQPGLKSMNWRQGNLDALAQAVQVSATPGAYAQWQGLAEQLLARDKPGGGGAQRSGSGVGPSRQSANGYARGTSGASPGWAWVGENGPELMKFKGGEPVLNARDSQTVAKVLPGYDKGGVVRGFRPGANATWVQALRSQLMLGESKHWGADLTRALRARDGIIRAVLPGTFTAFNGNRVAERVVAMIRRNLSSDHRAGRRGSHFTDWEWIAKQTGYDPTRLWRYWRWINPAVQHAKGIPGNVKRAVGGARGIFANERSVWVQALRRELGMPAGSTFTPSLTAPLRHIIAHGLGWKVGTHGHQEWSPRPWKRWTSTELAKQAAEQAIAEQTRSNQLNAQWDRLLKTLTGWGYSYAVRKLTDVGTSDGMDIARGLVKNKSLAGRYNANAKVEYDRSDALNGQTTTQGSQIIALLNAVRTSPAGLGLNALASQLSLSVDTTANLIKTINTTKQWADIPTAKRTRLLRESTAFGNLFRFANGGITPGSGNGDRVPSLLTPGELVLRKAATAALIKDYGPEVAGVLNNYDRYAVGGFVATDMRGMSMPGTTSVANYRGKGDYVHNKTVNYNFNTTVNNPIAETGGLSLQKRVNSIARLGILSRDE